MLRLLEWPPGMGARADSPQALGFSLATLSFQVDCPDPGLREQLKKRYGNFLAESRGGFEIQVETSGEAAADARSTPEVSREEAAWVVRLHRARAEFDLPRQCGRLQGPMTPHTFDSLLRILLTLLLLEKDGLLLHAATLERGGTALAFLGRSGAGKTTLARLAGSRQVLTDEISLVRLVEGEPRAYGSPFWGEMAGAGRPADLPLRAFHVLVKDQRNFGERLGETEAVKALLLHTLFFASDPELSERLLHLATRWAACVPVYRFHFVPDPSAWEALRKTREESFPGEFS